MSHIPAAHFAIAFLLALLLLTTACTDQAPQQEREDRLSEDFRQFCTTFTDTLWKLHPSRAIYEGYYKYDTLLPVPDAAHHRKLLRRYRRLLDTLRTFPPQGLNAHDRTDYYLIDNYLRSRIWYVDTFRQFTWNPSQYNVGGSFSRLLHEPYKPLAERLRAIGQRMQKVPAYYTVARKQLTDPTLEHTQLAVQQNRGTYHVFATTIPDSLEQSGLSEEEQQGVRQAAERAAAAVQQYLAWMEDTLQPRLEQGGARSFRIGAELYQRKFQYDIVSDYTPLEIYEKAMTHKAAVHDSMEMIAHTLWPQYFGERQPPAERLEMIQALIDTISRDHVHRDSFIVAIRRQIPELWDFVEAKNLLTLDPDKPLEVRPTPEYMRGVAGASISAPGPYDDPAAKTYYNVTPLDDYTEREAESYLREYSRYTLQILNIHEAIPGHYAQLVYSNKSPSLIKSIFGNGAMIEGWAVYTERMMLEEGYGDFKPELWLMYYKWNLRVICNTILDYSVQVRGMDKGEAMDLLMREAFQEKAEAEGKWRRATLTQVQLTSYFTGFMEIYEFREHLIATAGEDFDLKQFHEQFLSFGSTPVKYVKTLMKEEWEVGS